jgi:hypothetical protein
MTTAKLISAACALAAALALTAGTALAASPNTIYKDFADNGRLDGHYSVAELERVLRDAVVQGYGGPESNKLAPAVRQEINRAATRGARASFQSPPPAKKAAALPFTGVDLALISIGGLGVLLLGFGVRRFGRRAA